MKRWICLALALILCAALVAPAFASENVFVPSVTYKETPPVVNATIVIPPEIFDLADVPEELVEKIENTEEDFGQVDGCIVVTSILQAEEKTTDITQETRDILLTVYEELTTGAVVLLEELINGTLVTEPSDNLVTKPGQTEDPEDPTEVTGALNFEDKNFVVFHLVDVSFQKRECVDDQHLHSESLELDHTEVTIDFDLGVSPTAEVLVLTYNDNVWSPVKDVTNNGDGTITCVFEHFCPVAFCIEAEELGMEPEPEAPSAFPWIIVLLVCLVLLLLLLTRRRKDDEDDYEPEEAADVKA